MPDFEEHKKRNDVGTEANSIEVVNRNSDSVTSGCALEDLGDKQIASEVESLIDLAEVPERQETTTSTDRHSTQELASRLTELEQAMATGFERVLKSFELKLSFDQFKEDRISRLHNELQEYKAGLIAKTAQPLIRGIIRFHDDVGRMVEALRKCNPAELTPDRFFKVIQGFQQDIEIVLSDNGVDPYTQDGDAFDPHRQKALTTIPSADATMIGRIAARLRPGFEQSGAVLQKERVAVYVVAKPAAEPTDNDSEDAKSRSRQPKENK